MSVLAALVMSALVLAAPGGPPGGRTALDARLAAVETFALALGPSLQHARVLDRLTGYDLVVLDGVDADRALVDHLRARGVLVLGYLSVGTIERGRPWSASARRFRLDRWEEWDEWYADVDDPRLRSLLTDDVAPRVLDRGFDGLFLDNVDMVETHPRARAGMDRLVTDLAALVHGRGGFLFAQNGDASISGLVPLLDGWNREDVSTRYDFERREYGRSSRTERRAAQATLRRLADAGLLVTTTDYVARDDRAGADAAVARACAAGAVPFVSGIGLDRLPPAPPRCAARSAIR